MCCLTWCARSIDAWDDGLRVSRSRHISSRSSSNKLSSKLRLTTHGVAQHTISDTAAAVRYVNIMEIYNFY